MGYYLNNKGQQLSFRATERQTAFIKEVLSKHGDGFYVFVPLHPKKGKREGVRLKWHTQGVCSILQWEIREKNKSTVVLRIEDEEECSKRQVCQKCHKVLI